MRFRAKSPTHSPTRSSGLTRSQSPERLSYFLPALRRSTCSRATPIAAINFVPSCRHCPSKTMKLPTLLTRKKLRATTARRSLGAADEMDYEEMSEPNMKLSRALLIVLVLHVVAVAGIIAFNTIKSRQASMPAPVRANNSSSQPAPTKSQTPSVVSTEATAPATPVVKPVAKEERKAIPLKPAPESSVTKTESKKTYVVAKGDNPVSIA